MRQDFQKLFNRLQPINPPSGLLSKIMLSVETAQNSKLLKYKFAFYSLTFAGSIAAFFPLIKKFQEDLKLSSFSEILALVFSDLQTVLSLWQDFAMALLESMPLAELVALSAVSFIFLKSIKFIGQNFNIIFKSLNNNHYGH